MQDYPNYKYRPRRKKRDGQKGSGGGSNGANNNNKASNNNNLSGTAGGASPKHDLEDTKFESKSSEAGFGQHTGSSDTPPLYDTSETHAAATNLSRSFTIPTPESSPSSCTSDAYHSGYQPLPPAPPVNNEGSNEGEKIF